MKNTVGTVAASRKDHSAGLAATEAARVNTWLEKQAGAKATTSSPTAISLTRVPTRVTRPASSRPREAPEKPFSTASSESSPMAYMTSRKLRPTAAGRISTSSSAGGRGTRGCQPRFRNWPGTGKSRR